ncbi:MAG: hypothetical protein HY696_06345 [Deltaproteobacteria bacterium]|nr:hypothetical protein [Deltaproteobacteria bacterium]
MRVHFFSSFDRSYKRSRPLERGKIEAAVRMLLEYIERRPSTPPKGLGLKKLRGSVWEMRIDLQLRLVFTMEQDLLSFVLVGNHDDVRRWLRKPS